jgi:hypothetical protein
VSSPATDPQVIAAGATNTLRLLAQAAPPAMARDANLTALARCAQGCANHPESVR